MHLQVACKLRKIAVAIAFAILLSVDSAAFYLLVARRKTIPQALLVRIGPGAKEGSAFEHRAVAFCVF